MKTKTKKKTFAAEIAARNRKFQKATKAEKRVLIAKDVIAQVKADRFKPQTGTWASPIKKSGDLLFLDADFDEDDSVQKLFLSEKIPACNCCALGAMFMSCTLYNNKTKAGGFESEISWFDDLVENGGFSNEMDKFFSPDQLKLIESVFENNDGAFGEARSSIVTKWQNEFPYAKDRLVAIMKNIVRNKGTFKP